MCGWLKNGNLVFLFTFFLFFSFLFPSSTFHSDHANRQATSPSLWCFLSHLHPQTTFLNKPSTTSTDSSGCPINSSSTTTHHYHHHHHHQHHHAGLKFSPSEALGRLRRGKEGVSLPPRLLLLAGCIVLHFTRLAHLTHLPVINLVMLLLFILFSHVVLTH